MRAQAAIVICLAGSCAFGYPHDIPQPHREGDASPHREGDASPHREGDASQGSSDAGVIDASRADASGPPPPVGEPNIVFITSDRYQGNVGGLEGADAICNLHAQTAGLAGTYVAYLSSSTVDAIDRLGDARGWVRVDGKPFVDTVDDLRHRRLWHPVHMDENGTLLNASLVMTGTDYDGSLWDYWDNCHDYTTSEFEGSSGVGVSSGFATGSWSRGAGAVCSVHLRLYCFGIDHQFALQPDPAPGRWAFVSDEFDTASGAMAADAQCAAEATAAGLPGTYLALIAFDGQSALSRFDLTGPPWVRTDGVALTDTALELAASPSQMHTSLSVAADGTTYRYGRAWTGGSAPNGPAAKNCGNWTTSGTKGRWGSTSNPLGGWFSSGATPCTTPGMLYCLQE